jgi:3-dehydroquinate synthase
MPMPGFRPRDVHAQRFAVAFDYPVVFCENAFDPPDPTVAWSVAHREPERRHPLFLVLDEGLCRAQPDLVERARRYVEAHSESLELRGEPLTIPGGEACKNDPELVPHMQSRFAAARLDRQASVLVIGGGAVLDACGYAASTVHRGVRVVRMPSTVLSQCDGGVGVKNGINAFGGKNFLGTFAPPHAVVNDMALLRSLPLREARAGMAEAVKVALIKDPELFAWIEQHASLLSEAHAPSVAELTRRAAALHLRHIAEGGDPFETSSARPLDYGHWSAHRLEIASEHELRHGEAVAIGMLLDARYAERAGLLSAESLARLSALLGNLGLPRYHRALAEREGDRPAILAGLDEFREHLGGALTVTLLTSIGTKLEVNAMDAELVAEAIGWLEAGG